MNKISMNYEEYHRVKEILHQFEQWFKENTNQTVYLVDKENCCILYTNSFIFSLELKDDIYIVINPNKQFDDLTKMFVIYSELLNQFDVDFMFDSDCCFDGKGGILFDDEAYLKHMKDKYVEYNNLQFMCQNLPIQ